MATNREQISRTPTVEAETVPASGGFEAVAEIVFSAAVRLVQWVGRWAWWYRGELAPFAVALALFASLEAGLVALSLPRLAAQIVAALLAVFAFAGLVRRSVRLRHAFLTRRVRERRAWALRHTWPHVMRANGLAVVSRSREDLPTLHKIEHIPGGISCVVRLPRSLPPSEFEAARERIASDCHCTDASISPAHDLKHVRLDLLWDDPLAEPFQAPPLDQLSNGDIRQPAPVGYYGDGEDALLDIYQRHHLVGGASGSGKSVFVQQLLAWVALAENTRLFLLDAKGGVELGFWEQVAVASGGRFAVLQQEGIEVLDELIELMRARLAEMRERGSRKHEPTYEEPQIVVVIDELAAFTQGLDRKKAQEFNARLYELVAQGRAAGISVIAATQKPTIETVGAARDLFHYRVAFACPTPSMSDVILGEGQAAAGADASTIPQGHGGVGFILAEGDRVARRFRAFYLSDAELEALAQRCASARLDRQYDLPPLAPPAEEVGSDA
jgi:DNA segregation ATPase FtsK/SpoIIIE, S-DNA-T family